MLSRTLSSQRASIWAPNFWATVALGKLSKVHMPSSASTGPAVSTAARSNHWNLRMVRSFIVVKRGGDYATGPPGAPSGGGPKEPLRIQQLHQGVDRREF